MKIIFLSQYKLFSRTDLRDSKLINVRPLKTPILTRAGLISHFRVSHLYHFLARKVSRFIFSLRPALILTQR